MKDLRLEPDSRTGQNNGPTGLAQKLPEIVFWIGMFVTPIPPHRKQFAWVFLCSFIHLFFIFPDKLILFLTDGEPSQGTPNTILAKISDLNSALGNNVTILTYGLKIGECIMYHEYIMCHECIVYRKCIMFMLDMG